MSNKTIGFVGGGQLARMMIPAARQLGFNIKVLDPTPNAPAGQLNCSQTVGDFASKADVLKFAKGVDIITYDIESANVEALKMIKAAGTPVHPSPQTLDIIKDKLKQKRFLVSRKIPVAAFQAVTSIAGIKRAGKMFGYPLLLKSRFGAYDGRGNFVINTETDIETGFKKLAGAKLYVEQFVKFSKELAVMVARSADGKMETYPLAESIHKNNICHTVKVPAAVPKNIPAKVEKLVEKVVANLHGIGVFGIEMFLTKDGKVLINEIAPRVHNTGHYTIEACVTNQFEQHIRAISDLPLGDVSLKTKAAVMVNILGERLGEAQVTGLNKALALTGVAVHIYGKAQTKPDRKMGHITCIDNSMTRAYKRATTARKYIEI
jgi:5-(carboxyamino)imidazole ribonucleotide synthase